MDEKSITSEIIIPPPQENYEISFGIARDKFAVCDFAERAKKAGGDWNAAEKTISLNMLGRQLRVKTDDIDVVDPAGGKVELWEKIVLLHYLITAGGKPPTGKLISYKDIPDGRLYWPNFISRVHKPLLAAFASKPETMPDCAAVFGGQKYIEGDVGVKIQTLPRIELIFILWKQDCEFEATAMCVFDESITDYLPAEDITVLSSMIAIKMMKISFAKK